MRAATQTTLIESIVVHCTVREVNHKCPFRNGDVEIANVNINVSYHATCIDALMIYYSCFFQKTFGFTLRTFISFVCMRKHACNVRPQKHSHVISRLWWHFSGLRFSKASFIIEQMTRNIEYELINANTCCASER